jgi:hypothetical protein
MTDEEYQSKLRIIEDFPNLNLTDFDITSPADFSYNCHAWTAGVDSDLIMMPSLNPRYGWLTGDNSDLLYNFKNQFGMLGYTEESDNAKFESNTEKIALYVSETGEVKHTARQLENGHWTSKLGQYEHDIRHKTLECLENDCYGKVKVILKRPKKK